MDYNTLERQLAQLPLYAYFFLKTKELTFTQRVRHICRTQCPMYGKTWACPPAVGSVEECRRKCMAYPDFLLICTVTEIDDIADVDAALATRPEHEAITRQVEQMLQAQGLDVYTLSTEACSICPQCSYPDKPCRHPELMHPCIESHGILITETAERCGIPFQYGDNVVTWFSTLFYRPRLLASGGRTSEK